MLSVHFKSDSGPPVCFYSCISLHAGGWMVEKHGIRNEVAILKKTEFGMRSPSWIRAARSGPG